MGSTHLSPPVPCYVGVTGVTDKETEILEGEMVDQHCCAEKQPALSTLNPAPSVFVEQFNFF